MLDDELSVSLKNDNQVDGDVLLVLNKADLAANCTATSSIRKVAQHHISCSTGQGLEELERALARAVQGLTESGGAGDSPLITRERHRRHVKQCTEHLKMFLSGRLPMDAAAEELR